MSRKMETARLQGSICELGETGQFERERTAIDRMLKSLGRLIAILLLAAVAVVSASIYLYQRSGAWQMLIPPLAAGLNVILCQVALRARRQNRLATAGRSILAIVTIFFASLELAFSGASLIIAVTGLAAILLAGILALPKRWKGWLIAAILFGLLVLAINLLEPYGRYFSIRSPLLSSWIPGFGVALVVTLLIQVGSTLYRPTIRTRLLIAFVAMAILLAVIIGAGAVFTAVPRIERQVTSQLESVATLKEVAITTWVDSLESELSTVLASPEQLGHAISLALSDNSESQEYRNARRTLRLHLNTTRALTGRFEELLLISLDGSVILSTEQEHEGKSHANEPYFELGLSSPYTHPPTYSPVLATNMVMSLRPLNNQTGEMVALIAGRAGMELPTTIMQERSGMGESGATYLVGLNHAMLTRPISGESGRLAGFSGETDRVYAYTQGVNAAIDEHRSGSAVYENINGDMVIGVYRWLPELQVALMAEQNEEEALHTIGSMINLIVSLTLGLVLVAIVASVLITNSIANPIKSLVDTAQVIATGDRVRVAQVRRQDEVGALALAFNSMTQQLRDLIDGLEQRVRERTQEVERRSAYLEAAGEVAGAVSRILDPEELVPQVVNLIQERFGLYYVGLYLVSTNDKWADLRAGTGEAGRAMLKRGHRIAIGKGMIGWCIAQSEARIALEAGEDSVQLRIKELPNTRSEAAIPLRSRGQILGALSVQDNRPNAFDQEGITLLQTMADQIAVALDNAQLFAQSEAALQAQRRAFDEIRAREWLALLKSRPDWGYLYTAGTGRDDGGHRITPIGSDRQPQLGRSIHDDKRITDVTAKRALAVPLKIGDLAVGALHFRKAASGSQWTEQEIETLEAMADQLGIALENARLYQQTQMRAAREELSGDVGASLRQSLDVETVLRTAAQEIRQALDLPEVIVRLVPDQDNGGHSKEDMVES